MAKKSDLALAGSLKQTSIDNFFGQKDPMAKRKAKPAVTSPEKEQPAVNDQTPTDASPDFSESASPSVTEDEETSSDKGRHDISKSATTSPPTSVLNTPEPIANETGRVRLARTVKKRLPVSFIASASEADDSSVSDFHASEDQSDAVSDSQSAADCQETDESTAEEDDGLILPASKRIKLNKKNALGSSEFFNCLVYCNTNSLSFP